MVCGGGTDWTTFSYIVIPAGIAGMVLTIAFVDFLDKHTQVLRRVLIYIGKHTMFILGTQYLCFKAGNAFQVIFQGRSITWLEIYGVRAQESLGWKIVYFLCGLGIPLILLKGMNMFLDNKCFWTIK